MKYPTGTWNFSASPQQHQSRDIPSPLQWPTHTLPVASNTMGWQFLFEFQLHLSTCPPSTMLCWVVFAFGAPTRRYVLQEKQEAKQRFQHLRHSCYNFMTSEESIKQKSCYSNLNPTRTILSYREIHMRFSFLHQKHAKKPSFTKRRGKKRAYKFKVSRLP